MKAGDEVSPIPMNLKTLLMEEHVDAIPGSLTTQPYGSSRESGRCTPGCWPASQPWSQVKVSAALCRHAHGGVMPDPD